MTWNSEKDLGGGAKTSSNLDQRFENIRNNIGNKWKCIISCTLFVKNKRKCCVCMCTMHHTHTGIDDLRFCFFVYICFVCVCEKKKKKKGISAVWPESWKFALDRDIIDIIIHSHPALQKCPLKSKARQVFCFSLKMLAIINGICGCFRSSFGRCGGRWIPLCKLMI